MSKIIKIFTGFCLGFLSFTNFEVKAYENNNEIARSDKNLVSNIVKANKNIQKITFDFYQNNVTSVVLQISDADEKSETFVSKIDFNLGTGIVDYNECSIIYNNQTAMKAQLIVTDISGLIEYIDVSHLVVIEEEIAKSNEQDEMREIIAKPNSLSSTNANNFLGNIKPVISNITATKINYGSYKIEADVIADGGIQEITFPTWTIKNGQDDIVWGAAKVEGSKISYIVDMKDHRYETGEYATHIYVKDNSGNLSSAGVPIQSIVSENPQIGDVKIETINAGSYKIIANVSDSYGLVSVRFPTWTEKNGQDDIKWTSGVIEGNRATFIVDIKDHNYETGNYITHIYAENFNGISVKKVVPIQKIVNENPILKDIKVDKLNAGSYKISATASDDYQLDKVMFPTWTIKNGQDDILWKQGKIEGDQISCIVDIKDHNFEIGDYVTHVYIYDSLGATSAYIVDKVQLGNVQKPVIENLSVSKPIDGKYTIKVDVTDDYEVEKVQFPTWSLNNGQDDMLWQNGKREGNTFTYEVNIKDHKFDYGEYATHIYAYDREGKYSVLGVPIQTIEIEGPEISEIKIVSRTAGSYTIEATINDGIGLDRVVFPTWTRKNGQDDITWLPGVITGNKVTFTSRIDDHNFETGDYYTHIYAYNKAGGVTAAMAPTQTIINDKPTFLNTYISNQRADGYTVNAVIQDDYKLASVQFPTWTEKNGQDDAKWAEGTYKDGVYSYDVRISEHNNELGPYNTHIYATDVTGEITKIGIAPVTVVNSAPTISDVKISDIGSTGFTISCVVKDDLYVESVSMATWTQNNGQDDVLWGFATNKGNGIFELRVNTQDHGFESGFYETAIYASDSTGGTVGYAVPPLEISTILSPGWQYINGQKYLFNNQGKIVQGATKSVIDVSEHQGNINWQQVKNSGVDYVILRCGYGWQDDMSQIDKKFDQNADELERLGIPYGIYLFSYAKNTYDAQKEAEYALRILNGRKLALPIYYDLEYDKFMGDIDPGTYTAMAHAFCQTIERAGYPAGIYANLNYWNNKLNDPSLDRYTKWVAQFNLNDGMAGHCDYTKPYKVWQYSSVGRVPGIGGNVDMNAWY